MTYGTINDAVTIAGSEGTLLAGRYRVVRQLGAGGMGSVWLAEDTQLDNKQFAIKMLPPILVSNNRAYRQLKDEALVAMKLTYPNIVTLRAFEENSGNPFLVMDYVDGQTLDDYLAEKGKLSEDETIKLLHPIAAALDYAHSQGVVHRDVKPGNIMVRKDGTPYILDFGIAREIQETMTRVTGKLSSGTLLYMSPEQLNGDSPKPAQDIYSFAAMAYECIKGEPPFVRGAIEDQIKNKEPESLAGGTRLAATVMAGLAKKPEDRPPTCAAVLRGGISSRGAYPSADNCPRSGRLGKMLGVFILFAALVGAGYYGWMKYIDMTRKDLTRLAELQKDIFLKKRAVEQRKGELDKYRKDSEGLSSKIDEADGLCSKIAVVEAASTVSETEKIYAALRDDADAFDRALAWLADNKGLRDETRKLAGELAALDGELDRLNAKELACESYDKGKASREDGKSAFDHGDFEKAKKMYLSAKESLSKAIADSRKALTANALADAKKLFQAERWENCIAKCDEVLGIDSDNAEAEQLKAQAESHLVPSANIMFIVDGKPLSGVQVKIGDKTWNTPVLWTDKDITAGETYGGVEVSFERGGKRYFGTLEKFTVDWKGRKDFKVALKEYTEPKHGDTKTLTLPGGATIEMIYVNPGSFTMGSPDNEDGHDADETQHHVTLTNGYWLGKYEVTQKQWGSVMGSNPSDFNGEDLPVENVSWDDCKEFISKVNAQLNCGARLPTEAEWEYACWAGAVGAYAGGGLDSMGWYDVNSGNRTHPVGQKQANAWGFYDMHGNVWEWCNDWYDEDYYKNSPSADPKGPASGTNRVLRGGGWGSDARDCRSADRCWCIPGYRDWNIGFRLCCSALP